MKSTNLFRVAIVLVLLLSSLGVSGASAQGGLTWQSAFQVANMDATEATILLYFYNQDGTLAIDPPITGTIPGYGSKTYFMVQLMTDVFNGSMVIQSDKKIAAIANLQNAQDVNYNAYVFNASTVSFESGGYNVAVPLVMCDNSDFFTFFNVQNAGSADANITIDYIPAGFGVAYQQTATIKPGAAATFDQSKICTSLKGTSTKFIGSAQITSNQYIAVTVMQLNNGLGTVNFPVLMGYNGFAGSSSSVALPLIMSYNSGYYTSFQVQNAGTVETSVTVKYSKNLVGSWNPVDEVFTLAPGAAKTVYNQASGQWAFSNKYVGSAIITNSQSQPLVAIVNQTYYAGAGKAAGTSYEGFNPLTATEKINLPLIFANNSGWFTSVQVQNVGATNCAAVTLDYSANTVANGFEPVSEVFSLAAGASATIFQASGQFGPIGTTTLKYIGSALVTAPGCSIVAIVNQQSLGTYKDTFMTYDGFNY